jgi:hypothetical protein
MAAETTSFELKEPAPPDALVPSIGLWPWWVGGTLLVLLAILLLVVFRKRAVPPDPAAARNAAFREAMAALAGASAPSAREAAVQGSLILRRYLSAAAADPALFETHEEFVARRDSLNALTEAAREAAAGGFSRLAALKYAPEIPDADPAGVLADSTRLLETLHGGFAA